MGGSRERVEGARSSGKGTARVLGCLADKKVGTRLEGRTGRRLAGMRDKGGRDSCGTCQYRRERMGARVGISGMGLWMGGSIFVGAPYSDVLKCSRPSRARCSCLILYSYTCKMTPAKSKQPDGCRLFSMVQYQCSPEGGQVTCWPLERVFRQYVPYAPYSTFVCCTGSPAPPARSPGLSTW